jgi:hypothetical protein
VDEVGQYYTQEKANHCVVCGSNGSYIRKNVVPREYRKHFPGKLFIKLCLTFVMLLYVALSHGLLDPIHVEWQSSSVCVRIPSFFQPFHICAFACDISQHV